MVGIDLVFVYLVLAKKVTKNISCNVSHIFKCPGNELTYLLLLFIEHQIIVIIYVVSVITIFTIHLSISFFMILLF